MKKFLSLVLALVMTMSLVTVSAGAKDFADDSSITYKEAVDVISAIGVVDGYSDGSFGPDGALTRGAAAKIICNLVLGPTTASALRATTAPFKDVPTTNTFAGYITYCAQQGIINGYGDGTFRPSGTLTGNAFMKMLLGALGYDSSREGYSGANWQINVIKQAVNIGLDDGNDDFVGSNAVTRQEAALYAFNMLQADLVEYPNETIVTTGDVTVTTQGTFSSVRWGSSADEDGNIDSEGGDGYVQFAERYFNKLIKKADTDDFARPATTWVNDGDKIGTYVDDADVSYTSNVTLGTIYSDLDLSQPDRNAEVYYNGIQADDVAVTRNNSQKISSSDANDKLVGDGTIVDVYYASSTNDVTICVVDVYSGEIAAVNTTAADPYVNVTVHGSGPKTKTGATVSDFNNKFETTDSFDEEQIVLYTYSQSAKEIKSVVPAEYVEGEVSSFTQGKNLTMNNNTYKYAKNIEWGFGFETDMQTKGDYVVYMDGNGNAIFVDEQEFNPTDYAFVLNAQTANGVGFGKDQAKLVLANGDLMTVDTDDNYMDLIGQIVLYRADDNNEYALREAPNSTFNGAPATSAANSLLNVDYTNDNAGSDDYDTVGVALGGKASSATEGDYAAGTSTFVMKNGNAKVYPGNGTSLYANSETVFVVAQTTTTDGKTTTTYSAYTGIKNAPSIYGGAGVEMYYYVRGNNILAFAFIDATGATVTNGKNDVVFLAGDEGLTGRVYSSDGTDYYLYNAVVGGVVKQVKVATGAFTGAGDDTANYILQNPTYNNKDIITSIGDVSGNDYAVYDQYMKAANRESLTTAEQQGIWKLSGAYTIGIGGSRASDSIRLTVASNAQMYYIDTDGVITEIAEVSDIVSDTNDKVIALLDNSTGDVAYLFIQEVDSNSSENAPGGPAVLTGVTANYASGTPGTVTVNYTAPTADVNVTVEVQELSMMGEWNTVASKTQTVSGGTNPAITISVTLGAMTSHRVLVNGVAYSI